MDSTKPLDGRREAMTAHIGKSVVIKGELSGSEDLYVDGEVEGSIQLTGHSLTIGQNGRVKADVKARNVIVQGRVDGNISSVERVELRGSAVVNGDVQGERIAVEEGAFLKGKVETTKEKRAEPRQEIAAAVAMTSAAAAMAPPRVEAKQ